MESKTNCMCIHHVVIPGRYTTVDNYGVFTFLSPLKAYYYIYTCNIDSNSALT